MRIRRRKPAPTPLDVLLDALDGARWTPSDKPGHWVAALEDTGVILANEHGQPTLTLVPVADPRVDALARQVIRPRSLDGVLVHCPACEAAGRDIEGDETP